MLDYRKVVLDTNFLLIPGQFGVDIFEELQIRLDFPFKLYIMSGTLAELDKIIEKDKKKDKIAAEIAKKLLKSKKIKIIEQPEMSVDDALVNLSKTTNIIVATQDKELKSRLGCEKIILRQKKYVKLVR